MTALPIPPNLSARAETKLVWQAPNENSLRSKRGNLARKRVEKNIDSAPTGGAKTVSVTLSLLQFRVLEGGMEVCESVFPMLPGHASAVRPVGCP